MQVQDPKELCEGLKRRAVVGEVKEIDSQDRTLVAYASTKTVDSYREVILPTAFQLDRYRKNPVVPWSHNYHMPPVARALWVKTDSRGLLFKPQFARTQFADDIFNLYKDKFLNGFSVGYEELEYITPEQEGFKDIVAQWELTGDIRQINTKVDLWEISCCMLPANEDALVVAAEEGRIRSKALLDNLKVKTERGATPYADLPTAPEETDWDAGTARQRVARWASSDGSGEKEKIDWNKYRKAFFWYDSEDAENFGSYKLPFANVIGGELKAIWRGVAAAMAALLGARGGVDIPEGDKKAVYNHIAKYYEKFDKPIPEYKELSLLTIVQDLDVIKRQLNETSASIAKLWNMLKSPQKNEQPKAPGISLEEAMEIIPQAIQREIRRMTGKID